MKKERHAAGTAKVLSVIKAAAVKKERQLDQPKFSEESRASEEGEAAGTAGDSEVKKLRL